MASNFPTSLDSFSTAHADGVSEIIHAATVNDLADAVNKIETDLAINTSGVSGRVIRSGDTMTGALTVRPTGASLIDSTVWNARFCGLNVNQTTVGTSTPSSANQFALALQSNVNAVTSSLASYQKTGLIIQAQTIDDSNYGSSILRDCVGLDTRGIIGGTIQNGRAWGLNTIGQALAGADGYITASEFELSHTATDFTTVDSQHGKYGSVYTVINAGHGTSAIWLTHSTGQGLWHKGLYADTTALGSGAGDTFLELSGKFSVNSQSGKTLVGTATASFSPTMLEVIATATGNVNPLATFSAFDNVSSAAIRLRQPSGGAHNWGVCGTAGDFLTGTGQGDAVLQINTASKAWHLGGTTRVVTFNNANQLGFFAATPVGQPSTTGETVGFTAGGGTTVTDASTFTGNVGSTAYRISDIVKHLKNLGLIAA